ncbi:hypothetical protein Cgig2_024442 [Carnegiea gigantea]|uniref:BHLH domain-containing protein n=1 Tax=Carnegiea gigantea TaxID=171969 RepID=A0A9Q1KM25_9CARY|nr:hypothetical protein Cgig2_024442 [Carnegiea gigantea]
MTELRRSISPVDEENLRSTASKRPRVDLSMSNKERKEKFGERIAALQQLVSPYGKTDTASVLLEAMDYIKFLHEQVKVLSAPYLHNTPIDRMETRRDKDQVRIWLIEEAEHHGIGRYQIFIYDKNLHAYNCRLSAYVLAYLWSTRLNKNTGHGQYSLRSKGLCLVPTSYTAGLPRGNGADIWAPTKSSSPRY